MSRSSSAASATSSGRRWYAGYVVEHDLGGVLGTTPTIEEIAAVLTEATADLEREGGDREWSEFAAERAVDRLG